MERDFTDSLEEEMLDMVEFYDTYLTLQITDEEVDAYQDYWDHYYDKQYAMEHIEAHKQYIIDTMGYDAELISGIFEEVRAYDASYQDTVSNNSDTCLGAYIESLSAMVDTIRVVGPKKPYNTQVYSLMARQNYGQWGEVSSEYAGIFAGTSIFSQHLKDAGTGVVGQTYADLQNPEKFKELMNKPVNEIKTWEVAALSLMFDDCIDGNGKIDYVKLNKLVNSCYIIEHTSICTGSVMGFYEEMNYDLAPVMSLVSEYKTNESFKLATMYDNNDMRLTYGITMQEVESKCNIADVIFALDTYYSKHYIKKTQLGFMQDGGIEVHSSPIKITYNENGGIVTISFIDVEDKVTIYEYCQDMVQKLNNAESAVIESGISDPGKEIFISGAKFAVEQAIGFIEKLDSVNTVYGIVDGIYGMYDSYNDIVANNEACYNQISAQELQNVAYITGCSGSVVQCGDRYDIRNLGFDTSHVIVDVALYNEAIERGIYPIKGEVDGIIIGDTIDTEKIDSYLTVQQEFNDYINGIRTLEECTSINALSEFQRAEKCYVENPEEKIYYNYSHYEGFVEERLKENTGKENGNVLMYDNAEVEKAAEEAAKMWFDEME